MSQRGAVHFKLLVEKRSQKHMSQVSPLEHSRHIFSHIYYKLYLGIFVVMRYIISNW
jgi:hypothetical protein